MVVHYSLAPPQIAVTVQVRGPTLPQVQQHLSYSRQRSEESGLGDRTCAPLLQENDLVHRLLPVRFGPLRQVMATDQSRFVIVGAEIHGARMRNFDRDKRD